MKRRILKRLLTLFMTIIILITSIFMPFASAVVVETLVVQQGIELLLTILIGVGGATFRNEIDARAVAEVAWNALEKSAPGQVDVLLKRAKWLNDHPDQAQNAGFRVSADLWNAIKDTLTGFFADGKFIIQGGDTFSIESSPSTQARQEFLALFETRKPASFSFADGRNLSGTYGIDYSDSTSIVGRCYFSDGTSRGVSVSRSKVDLSAPLWFQPIVYGSDVSMYLYYTKPDGTVDNGYIYEHKYPVSVTFGSLSFTATNDLAYPSEDFLVKAPDLPSLDLDGNITHPSLDLSPDAYAVPYPVYPGTGDKIESIPFDVPVDVGTGESLDKDIPDNPDVPDTPDIPILGDILGLLKQILDALISLLRGIWDAIKGLAQSIVDGIAGIFSWLKAMLQAILDALTGFFDSPSNFRLNFDSFKNLILPQRFPFCIPFDFVNCIRVWAVQAQDYVLRIDLDTSFLTLHHVVDLSPFAVPIGFFRYVVVVWFVVVLIMRTRDMMKW